jgi:hypothetical protein
MEVTIEWLEEKFEYFNNRYFKNRLATPNFKFNTKNNMLGFYKPDGTYDFFTRKAKVNGPGTIYISAKYDRDEKDFEEVLIHEMIHMYINTVKKIYPRKEHDEEFYKIANCINKDGWNISEETELKTTDKEITNHTEDVFTDNYVPNDENQNSNNQNTNSSQNNNSANMEYYICFIQQPYDKVNKYWGFRADITNIQNYIKTARSLKNVGAKNVVVFKTNNNCISQLKYSPDNLYGIGGNSVVDILYKISKLTNGEISYDELVSVGVYNL